MAQKISQMTEQTTASMTEAGTSDFLGGYTATGGNANRKFSLSGLANYFLNKFKMTLGGSSQTVKSAIDTLNSNMTKIILSESLSVPKDSSATVTLPSRAGSFLCAWRGTNAVWRGLALITKASTSDGICTVLYSNMSSVSESGNVLTFTNQHSNNDQTYYIRVTEISI